MLDFLISFALYKKIEKFSESQNINNKYDVGVVFFHSMESNKSLSDESKYRLNIAVDLYHNKKIDHFICVGGYYPPKSLIGSIEMKKYLVEKSISGKLIPRNIYKKLIAYYRNN